jgi:hypothetical protein
MDVGEFVEVTVEESRRRPNIRAKKKRLIRTSHASVLLRQMMHWEYSSASISVLSDAEGTPLRGRGNASTIRAACRAWSRDGTRSGG